MFDKLETLAAFLANIPGYRRQLTIPEIIFRKNCRNAWCYCVEYFQSFTINVKCHKKLKFGNRFYLRLYKNFFNFYYR